MISASWGMRPRTLASTALLYREASNVKIGTEPAAEWLTIHGMAAFPNWTKGGKVLNSAVVKVNSDYYAVYPTWARPLNWGEAKFLACSLPGVGRGCHWWKSKKMSDAKDYRAFNPSVNW